ncbi:uncharacterized protein LOC108736099 [Agrilus planipennis]|uniref:Uncharacterized protein LOC108736099 n=1 Tax=Agrilus planipennis TaxID=224129 RepID=A0A1W4WIX5_AGRPL|nr:uncharacterized protein LOC108736099 [Agrilus planipennis]
MMSLKVLFATVLGLFAFSEGLIRIENKSAISPLSTTVVGSNMPVTWQVEAAELLTNVLQLYNTNNVRARALSELFEATHINYSWFVAVNSSYIYNPLSSYYCQLRTETTSGNTTNIQDFVVFAGNS